jgi:hypothetical protein
VHRGVPRRIRVEGVTTDGNRRQGVSVVSAEDVTFRGCRFRNTRGTPPEGGVDLEPDDPRWPNRNIVFIGCDFEGNTAGIYATGGNEGVLISACTFRDDNGVIIGDRTRDLRMVGCHISVVGSVAETAAVRAAAVDHGSIQGVDLIANHFQGGHVAVDFPVDGPRQIRIRENRIVVAAPGQRAVRLLAGGAEFKGNNIVVEGAGGIDADGGEWTHHFHGSHLGDNRYVNSTSPRRSIGGLERGQIVLTSDEVYEGGYRRSDPARGATGIRRSVESRSQGGRFVSPGRLPRGRVVTVGVSAPGADRAALMVFAYGAGEGGADPAAVRHLPVHH